MRVSRRPTTRAAISASSRECSALRHGVQRSILLTATQSRYNPLFMNDAAPYQDPYTSYGETNLAKLQAAKLKYDPTGFFTDRQGGFKLPA